MVKKAKEKEGKLGLYDQLSHQDAERDIALPKDEEDDGNATLADRWDSASLSDMQFTGSKLFPEMIGDSISNKIQIARIAPEIFISVLRLQTVEDIMQTPSDKPISVVQTMIKNYILLSIGLDGKGRIDLLELAGSSRETEELEKLGKGLF